MSSKLTCSGKAFDLLLTFDLYVVWSFWDQSIVYIVRPHNVLQSGRRRKTGYKGVPEVPYKNSHYFEIDSKLQYTMF